MSHVAYFYIETSANDYKIIQEIGKGASSIVYKVRSLCNNGNYAMKVITKKHLEASKQKEALREVLFLKKIQHPHIIRFHTSFIEDNQLYILTEYAELGDLYSLIKTQRSKKMHLAENEIWRLLWGLSLAVLHLHVHNVMHRDIKTLNMFLTKDRSLKVL